MALLCVEYIIDFVHHTRRYQKLENIFQDFACRVTACEHHFYHTYKLRVIFASLSLPRREASLLIGGRLRNSCVTRLCLFASVCSLAFFFPFRKDKQLPSRSRTHFRTGPLQFR